MREPLLWGLWPLGADRMDPDDPMLLMLLVLELDLVPLLPAALRFVSSVLVKLGLE